MESSTSFTPPPILDDLQHGILSVVGWVGGKEPLSFDFHFIVCSKTGSEIIFNM